MHELRELVDALLKHFGVSSELLEKSQWSRELLERGESLIDPDPIALDVIGELRCQSNFMAIDMRHDIFEAGLVAC